MCDRFSTQEGEEGLRTEHMFARVWSRPLPSNRPRRSMRRYATAPLSTFEDLFDRARTGTIRIEATEYPAVCSVSTGEVTFALGRTGAMIMHVRPGACSSPEFRLRLLFETGACVLSSPRDLGHFCTGLLAAAFGIEPSEPIAAAGPSSGRIADERALESGQPANDLLADLGAGTLVAATTTTGEAREQTETGDPASPLDNSVQLPLPPRRALTAEALALELEGAIHGQAPALERVASATVAQLTKRHPVRPGSVILIGPSGVGKTSTIEALPRALHALGTTNSHVFRIDCAELTDSIQVTRLLGSPPGYAGHTETTPLIAALSKPGCILLVDELDRAHDDILDLLLGLLDAGRLTTPAGRAIDAKHSVVALTTSVASEHLTEMLDGTPLEDRWAVQRACVEHLRASGIPADLLARIGAFAFYRELVEEVARTEVARAAIASLGCEYGLIVGEIDPVVLDVIEDIANDSGSTGARALHHAARELLAGRFADLADGGARLHVAIDAGPPLAVRAATSASRFI